uniref:Uncharacterized protein n=1 Tax=Hainan astro-like virus 1 TaxID=2116149 RepID=A0A2P1GMC5_9VIRU|nr:hypothetical protein [Hainan astro-like virus 1]
MMVRKPILSQACLALLLMVCLMHFHPSHSQNAPTCQVREDGQWWRHHQAPVQLQQNYISQHVARNAYSWQHYGSGAIWDENTWNVGFRIFQECASPTTGENYFSRHCNEQSYQVNLGIRYSAGPTPYTEIVLETHTWVHTRIVMEYNQNQNSERVNKGQQQTVIIQKRGFHNCTHHFGDLPWKEQRPSFLVGFVCGGGFLGVEIYSRPSSLPICLPILYRCNADGKTNDFVEQGKICMTKRQWCHEWPTNCGPQCQKECAEYRTTTILPTTTPKLPTVPGLVLPIQCVTKYQMSNWTDGCQQMNPFIFDIWCKKEGYYKNQPDLLPRPKCPPPPHDPEKWNDGCQQMNSTHLESMCSQNKQCPTRPPKVSITSTPEGSTVCVTNGALTMKMLGIVTTSVLSMEVSSPQNSAAVTILLLTTGIVYTTAAPLNVSGQEHNVSYFGQSCQMDCNDLKCIPHGNCSWWCDGKANYTGQCGHICWIDPAGHVRCRILEWMITEQVLHWLLNEGHWSDKVILAAILILFLFWLIYWRAWKWMKPIMMLPFCQVRGSMLYKKQLPGFATRLRSNGATFTTKNWCLMLLIAILTCFQVRPTRAVNVGPSDFGRMFTNGSVSFTFLTMYEWYNKTGYGLETCLEQYPEISAHMKCCSDECGAQGLTSDCRVNDKNVCGFASHGGGGWTTGCFCISSNIYDATCKGRCRRIVDIIDFTDSGDFTGLFTWSQGGNSTMVLLNHTGTTVFNHANFTNVSVTVSGCIGENPGRLGFPRGFQVPPIDVTGCPIYKNGYLQEGCVTTVEVGYQEAHATCHLPPNCHGQHKVINGKVTHGGFESFLTCGVQFKWSEYPCQPDSQATLVGCDGGSRCYIVFNNCTSCCWKGSSVVSGQKIPVPCNNCTFNGTYYDGEQYQDIYHRAFQPKTEHGKGNWEAGLRNGLVSFWEKITSWIGDWKWVIVALVALFVLLFLIFIFKPH